MNNIEKIGELADAIDNISGALELPMPPSFHVNQLKKYLPEWSQILKDIYESETEENPWL